MNWTVKYERPSCDPWLYDFALHTFVKGVNSAAGGLAIKGTENFDDSSNTILASAHRHGIVDACVLAQTVDKLTDHKKIFFMSKKEKWKEP